MRSLPTLGLSNDSSLDTREDVPTRLLTYLLACPAPSRPVVIEKVSLHVFDEGLSPVRETWVVVVPAWYIFSTSAHGPHTNHSPLP